MDNQGLPAPPSPTNIAVWTGQVRTVIAVLGGLGLGGAALQHVTDQQISNELTAGLTVFGFLAWAAAALWSRYSKWEAARADRASSVLSAVATASATARAGVRMPVIVVPAPTVFAPSATATMEVKPTDIPSNPPGEIHW